MKIVFLKKMKAPRMYLIKRVKIQDTVFKLILFQESDPVLFLPAAVQKVFLPLALKKNKKYLLMKDKTMKPSKRQLSHPKIIIKLQKKMNSKKLQKIKIKTRK